jgi:predicted ester cyclase
MLSQLLITTCWDTLADTRPVKDGAKKGLSHTELRFRHNVVFGCAGCRLVASCTVLRGPAGKAGQKGGVVSTEENKALSNRVAQAISKGDLDALDALMAPELAEEFKRDLAEIRRAFPDYGGTNVDQIAEGEMVANRFVFLGTHLGEFEGVSPTGKRVEFVGHSIDRVVEGKIVESWVEVDMLGVLEQLGVVPEPKQPEDASPT